MIDTIKFKVRRQQFQSSWQKLEPICTFIRLKYKYGVPYKVFSFNKGIYIEIGDDHAYFQLSLPKFYYGSNVIPLSFQDIRFALKRLEDVLGFKGVWNATLVRIDFALTFHVSQHPSVYINCLTKSAFFKSYSQYEDETVRYGKTNYQLLFYNKSKETGATESRTGIYLLRCELQLQRHLSEQFRRKSVRIIHLQVRSFLAQLEALFQISYFKTFRRNSVLMPPDHATIAALKDFYIMEGIHNANGVADLSAKLKEMVKLKQIKSTQRRYFLQHIWSLHRSNNRVQKLDIFKDLDEQVRQLRF